MKLSIKALALSAAIIWGFALLIVGITNIIVPGYAVDFLEVIGSIYPGYHPGTGIYSAIIGSLYGVLDAGIGAAIFAWLYNFFAE
ncbi:MAG: hypothetical protein IIB73_05645 [Proteobacteria bacterium]|nr:hypothetical protein [Pseudomonadota bacterium]